MATGMSSVATLSMFIGLPVSITLSDISLAEVSVSGVATTLTSKYQKKLTKVMKLLDIITTVIAIFETSLSKALNSVEVDQREFQVLQELHLNVINEMANIDHKVESETRTGRDKRDKENLKNERCLMICTAFPVCYIVCYQNG